MTMPIRFDTQQYIKTLIQGGHTQDQAEAQAQAVATALIEGTVAPSELLLLKVELLARMDALKAEILAALEIRLQEFKIELKAELKAELLAEIIPIIKTEVEHSIAPLRRLVWLSVGMSALSLAVSALSLAANAAILVKLFG